MNINERVEIELTRHDLALVRYQNGQIKDALTMINNLQIRALTWTQQGGSEDGSDQEGREP